MGRERFFDEPVMGYNELYIGIRDEHWLDYCLRMLITVFYRYLGEWGNLGECRGLEQRYLSCRNSGIVSKAARNGGTGLGTQQEDIGNGLELCWMLRMG
jgi:hypothetical protein